MTRYSIAHGKNMANGILKNLNRSLEITLRDNLDGLTEFALMMASTSVRPQYEILPVERKHSTPSSPQPAALSLLPSLRLPDAPICEECPSIHNREKRRA
jgi:hypothetical protein